MTLGELRAVLSEIADENEANADREVKVRVKLAHYEDIPWGNVEKVTVAMRPCVVIDLIAGR